MTNFNQDIKIKRALISSWRKDETIILARVLYSLGVTILASSGTADVLENDGIPVDRISGITRFENLLGGRVKTLHPAIHAAILARRDNPDDMKQLAASDIKPLDLVAVDLNPFPEAGDDIGIQTAIELIDIGGVALIRASAKNYQGVAALSTADQFITFSEELKEHGGSVSIKSR